jgi:hypothetical protein
VHQILSVDSGIDTTAEPKRDIEGSLRQVGQCEIRRDVKLDIWMGSSETVQAGSKPARDVRRKAGDANTGAFSSVNTRNCASDFCEPASHTSGKSFTFQRHLDPARVP